MSKLYPTWLDVLALLEKLGDHPVTRERVALYDAGMWGWAVHARGPDDKGGSHPGPSPFLRFALGQPAPVVARMLPMWCADRCLRHVTAEELAGEALRDPVQRRRYEVSRAVTAFVRADHGQWRWLRDLIEVLNPDPLTSDRDDWDEDHPLDIPRRPPAAARDVPRAPAARSQIPDGPVVPRPASTRPTLWRRRDGA